LHRLDGPAYEDMNGKKEWWIDGEELIKKQFEKLTKKKTETVPKRDFFDDLIL